MESIAQNFKDNYRIINIQYPTTKETAEEISDLYIEPNIENIKEQIFSENFHKKINKKFVKDIQITLKPEYKVLITLTNNKQYIIDSKLLLS